MRNIILCRIGPNRANIHSILIFTLWNLGALFSTLEQGLEPRLVAGAADVKWHLKVKMNMMFSVWRMCRLPSFWPWVLLHVTQNIVKLRIGKTTCMYAMQQCVCVLYSEYKFHDRSLNDCTFGTDFSKALQCCHWLRVSVVKLYHGIFSGIVLHHTSWSVTSFYGALEAQSWNPLLNFFPSSLSWVMDKRKAI